MRQLHVTTADEWRQWLAKNHLHEKDGVWLVFYKKETGRPSIDYDESVEEALCFGWVDSLIKRIDDASYCRKYTPRKNNSLWSASNKERVQKIIQDGRMTKFGQAKVDAAKKSGRWKLDPKPIPPQDVPMEFSEALSGNKRAKDFFETLAPGYRRTFVLWIASAKRPETRAQRITKSLALLAKGQKLPLV